MKEITLRFDPATLPPTPWRVVLSPGKNSTMATIVDAENRPIADLMTSGVTGPLMPRDHLQAIAHLLEAVTWELGKIEPRRPTTERKAKAAAEPEGNKDGAWGWKRRKQPARS